MAARPKAAWSSGSRIDKIRVELQVFREGAPALARIRTISVDGLRHRLAQALVGEPLLQQRFDRALATRDEKLVDAAMDSLRLYPTELREQVEEILLTWLFDGPFDVPSDLACLPGEARH